MKIQTPGLIIKETNIGENDKLLVILTHEHGIIRAFADGVRRMKSKNSAATSLLCYSNFTLYQSKDTYKVTDSSPIELFFDLRYNVLAYSNRASSYDNCFIISWYLLIGIHPTLRRSFYWYDIIEHTFFIETIF